MRDPSPSELDYYLKIYQDQSPDFALLAFSGHGEVVKTTYSQDMRLYLNTEKYTTDAKFTLNADRELVILDACRELRQEPELIKKSYLLNATNESFSARHEDPLAVSRKLYEEAINACPRGKTIIYSCSVNETAADNPSFTRIMIREAELAAREAVTRKTISSRQACNKAALVIDSTFKKKQTPVYEAGRRLTDLPFAVSV